MESDGSLTKIVINLKEFNEKKEYSEQIQESTGSSDKNKSFKCKMCEIECDDFRLLGAHYRKKHPRR